MRTILVLTAALALGFPLTACDRAESPQETREDVQEARDEGAAAVAEERQEAAQAQAQASQDVAKEVSDVQSAQAEATRDSAEQTYDIEVAQAEATRKVAKEQCDAQTGDARDACQKAADAAFEQSKADAQMRLDDAKLSTPAQDADK